MGALRGEAGRALRGDELERRLDPEGLRALVAEEAPGATYLRLEHSPVDGTRVFRMQGGSSLPLRGLRWIRYIEDTPESDAKDGRYELHGARLRSLYKARPLNGIWATAPFLHNGSVPNLAELLTAPDERRSFFFVGEREYDPVHVGLESDAGPFRFDTTLPGNSNAGHAFGSRLSPPDKEALIEYLKSL